MYADLDLLPYCCGKKYLTADDEFKYKKWVRRSKY